MGNIVISSEEFTPDVEKQFIGYENLSDMIEILIDVVENSSEFKKLADKAQVIFSDSKRKDIRTRLTHSYDVARISERVAEKLGNSHEEQRLAYLIGLCHDLGHTAFGHDGESRIDAALRHYKLSPKDVDERWYGEEEEIGEGTYEKVEYSFEHHAHSVRVFNKILKDANIELSEDLMADIQQGILCHSESRTKEQDVRKIMWALARYADKIYSYTDMLDILNSGIPIDSGILDGINENDRYITDKNGNVTPFSEQDKEILEEILGCLREENGIEKYIEQYIEGVTFKGNDGYGTCVALPKIQKEMKLLKTIVKYLRQEKKMEKQELLARAMIDEVIEYAVEHSSPELSMKDRVYRATIIVANASDTEIREQYKLISKDKEWQEARKANLDYGTINRSANERSKDYPIKLSKREAQELIEDPDRIIQTK